MHFRTKTVVILVMAFILYVDTNAQSHYSPTESNLVARKWFQDAKFGLFIHWGVYSVRGRGEWVMYRDQIPIPQYEQLPAFFNPIAFDAAEWVSMAKDAGMKYITITSKHHDGFAMFDSKVSDWDIIDRTPYKKDVMKMLAEECQRQGLKLCFYYSQLDWHHSDYWPLGRTGDGLSKPAGGDWNKYLEYQNAQLTELLTNYGEIGGIWFDGWWDKKNGDWQLGKTYELIHSLQPQVLIGNNHHMPPFDGEDFQMFEKDLPGRNTTGFSGDSEIGDLPLETCETINNSWGFNLTDRNYKSTRELVQYLVKAAGNNANFLLNVGPMPNGKIQPEFVKILTEIGQWLEVYGESIYSTRGGPIEQRPWGVTTAKEKTVYVHILDWQDKTLSIPLLEKKVRQAVLLNTGEKIRIDKNSDGMVLHLPVINPEDFDTIVKLIL